MLRFPYLTNDCIVPRVCVLLPHIFVRLALVVYNVKNNMSKCFFFSWQWWYILLSDATEMSESEISRYSGLGNKKT